MVSGVETIVRNGVVQPMNRVIMPPPSVNIGANSNNLVQVLMLDNRFTDLSFSLVIAGLTGALESRWH